MVTTAYRSMKYMQKMGYTAEVVEHRRGSFIRKDLFDIGDVLACRKNGKLVLIQAYRNGAEKQHAHLSNKHPMVNMWLSCGALYQHHIWSKTPVKRGGAKRWRVKIKLIAAWALS